MNVIQSSSSSLLLKKQQQQQHDGANAAKVNFYKDTPTLELSLDEFEVYALKRLKVLRKMEQLKMMRIPADQASVKIAQLLKQQDLHDNPVVDQVSHFILRLSYCQSEELRRWFLTHESALFQHRLAKLNQEELIQSVKSHCQLQPIGKAEKERVKDSLLCFVSPAEYASSTFYAVPFAQALDLVATRQCFLRHGMAYVPVQKVLSILVARFRMQLSKSLALLASAGGGTSMAPSEGARLGPLLQNMSRVLVHDEPQHDHGDMALTAATLPNYTANMPLCMRQLQTGLVQDKKLKHWGRLQYGLFLKGAGLDLDQALAFFQRHFSKVTGEVFQKQYAYNIRHMYGKEGKRSNYTPYNCSKIILGNAPSGGDHHGCPYKHYDADHLQSMLQQWSIGTSADRNAIVGLKKSMQYQLACQKHFEVMHPAAVTIPDVPLDNVGNHPNAWFRASVSYQQHHHQQGATNPDAALSAPANSAGSVVSP